MAVLGHGQELRDVPGTAHITLCQNSAPKPKEQELYLQQCSPTGVPFVQRLVTWICLEKHKGHLVKVRQPPSRQLTPTHPVLGALWATMRAEIMYHVLLGQGLVPVVLELTACR